VLAKGLRSRKGGITLKMERTALCSEDCREQCATPCSALHTCGPVPKGESLERLSSTALQTRLVGAGCCAALALAGKRSGVMAMLAGLPRRLLNTHMSHARGEDRSISDCAS
jgi:hypothetical protein